MALYSGKITVYLYFLDVLVIHSDQFIAIILAAKKLTVFISMVSFDWWKFRNKKF
jgi:hypothetical protein